MEPASPRVNEDTTKSGVERPPSAMAKGVRLATSMMATSESGTTDLDRVGTSFGLAEAVDGDRFALALPLRQELLEEDVVVGVRNAKATALLPKKELFSAGQESVPEVEFKGATVGIPVRDGVDDGIAGNLVGPVLNHVAKIERFVVAEEALVDLGLDAAGEFLKPILRIAALYFLEEPTRSARHSRTDHAFSLCTASYSKNRSFTLEISIVNDYLFIMNKKNIGRHFPSN